MIDEKRLGEISGPGLMLHISRSGDIPWSADEHAELIRLARLALWAREHGIPAMRFAEERADGPAMFPIFAALAALPKGEG